MPRPASPTTYFGRNTVWGVRDRHEVRCVQQPPNQPLHLTTVRGSPESR